MTKRQERGTAREQLVITAAAEVIAERGLANVRVTDVAERAGMSPGHVSYYFPSKPELLMRAITASEQSFTAEVVRQLQAIEDPWLRLTRLVELSVPTGPKDPGWVLWFEMWASAAQQADVALVQEQLDARTRAIMADVIGYGCRLGAFHATDPGLVATVLSAIIDGLSIQLTLGSERLSSEVVVQLCLQAAHSQLG